MKAMVVVASLWLAACGGKDSSPPADTGDDRGPAQIELSVGTLLYEATAVDTTATKSITVKNIGGAELEVQSVQVADPFRTTFNLMTLQPGGAGIITVVFAPTSHGHFEKVLSVLSSDPNHPSAPVNCVGDTIQDADGDGFDAGFDPGQDCDDSNPNINPAAPEIWYNGVNDNCICEWDKRCSDYDQDGDGYDYIGYNADPKDNGGDCNDINPDINPGAADAWYDGYDTNCDFANDNDQDGDGFSSSEHTAAGTDCDDLDPAINTDGTETYDGKDDDCNGHVDAQILDQSTAIMIIGSGNDGFGTGLTSGLLDEDFTSDVIAGSPKYGDGGAIMVFKGGAFPATGSVGADTADALIEGASGDELGSEIAYLDDFGKGGAHLAVGATNYSSDKGYAAVLLGSEVVAGSSLDDSTVLRIEGTTSGASVGQGLANDLDLDGDGYDELMGSVKSGSSLGLWLFAGDTTLTGVHTTTEADARFDVTGTDTAMLGTFPGGGNDFDGDGYDDFLFCNGTGGDDGAGETWILWGGSAPYSNTSSEEIGTAGSTIATGSSTMDLGYVCGSAGDWTGDGKAEVWMYSVDTTDLYLLAGDDTLHDGPVDVTTSYLALYSFDSFSNNPAELRDVGDLDDTTGHEMAISISADSTSIVPGQVYIFGLDLGFGAVPDSIETLAQASLWGDETKDAAEYGGAISGHAADVTGAGGTFRTDIVVADPGYLSNAGAVYVYPNYNE